MEDIKEGDIHKLLEHFSKCVYKAKETDSKVGNRALESTWFRFTHSVWKLMGCSSIANRYDTPGETGETNGLQRTVFP
jgi:hypothetical protein